MSADAHTHENCGCGCGYEERLAARLADAERERGEARSACEKAIRERHSLEKKEDDWHTAYERAESRLQEAEKALQHYAAEGHWDDVSPPESVNTAGYLVWEYAGGNDLPWSAARAALDRMADKDTAG